MGSTRIIGIDPGSRITGYGVIDSDGQNYRLVEAGCIRLPDSDFSVRLKRLHEQIRDVCNQHKPHSAAVEQVFYARNVRSALQLGQVRGVILLSLITSDCEIFEYSALEVKSAVTGYGRAEKHQLRKMIEMMVHADFGNSKYDVTDALGLAITHAQISSFRSKLR
jgi:crossover junction endodeoxyribonuclease RuvC